MESLGSDSDESFDSDVSDVVLLHSPEPAGE